MSHPPFPLRPPAKARRRKPVKPPRTVSFFRIFLAVALIGVAISTGTVAGVLASTFHVISLGTEKKDGAGGGMAWGDNWTSMFNSLDRRVNVLVMGSDYNYSYGKKLPADAGDRQTRSDTLMLMGIDPQRGTISILSIPRDTRTLISGSHYDKINAAMAYGGVDLAKQTVTDLTGVPIDYHLSLKIDGLIKLVDIMGGVEIYVEKDMYYVDESAHLGINIHKGWKRMNGEQAHQFVRFRKDELGDIGRVQRQQKFIRATMDKLMQPQTLLRLPELMQGVQDNINTDMPLEMMGQIAKFAKGLDKSQMRMVMLPGNFSGNAYSVSYWLVDYAAAREVITEMFPDSSLGAQAAMPGETPLAEASSDPAGLVSPDPNAAIRRFKVSLWNGTKDLNAGKQVIKLLREAGWNVWSVRLAPAPAEKTQFIAQRGKVEMLDEFQAILSFPGEKVAASVGDIATDFTIVLGEDYVQTLQGIQVEQNQMERDAYRKRNIENRSFSGTPRHELPPDYSNTVDPVHD